MFGYLLPTTQNLVASNFTLSLMDFLGSPGISNLGSPMRLQSDSGWGRSHLKVRLGWTSKMPSSHSWQVVKAGSSVGAVYGSPHWGLSQHGGGIPRSVPGVSTPGDQAGDARLLVPQSWKSHGMAPAMWFGPAHVQGQRTTQSANTGRRGVTEIRVWSLEGGWTRDTVWAAAAA